MSENKKIIDIKTDHVSQSVKITTVSHYENENTSDSGTSIYTGRGDSKTTCWTAIMGDIYAEDDPQLYSTTKKNIIIFIIALCGISSNIGNMIYMPDVVRISQDLNTTLTGMTGTISVYVVFLGVAPLFWACMSDTYGRKPMYVISLIFSIVASILCAVSSNITMLIIFRAIQACGTSSGQTLGAGVIADTIDPPNRGRAYGIFYVGPLLGHVIGPTIGGVLCQYLGWQSSFYFLAILGTVLLMLVIFLLPETLRKKRIVMDEKHAKDRFKALKNLKAAFCPMIGMLGDPTVLLITLYNTVILSCFYFLTPTITETFQALYNYTSFQIGLCYIFYGAGLVVGSVTSGRYADFVLARLRKKKGKENVYPEMILKATFPSFILMPAGYLLYGWSTQMGVAVYAPLAGLFIYSFGQMFAFAPSSLYLVDSKPGRSASAVAINNCVRSVIAAITAIFSSTSLNAVGPGILFSILAVLNVINIITVLLVMVYGKKWRTNFEERIGTGEKPTVSDSLDLELAIIHSRISSIR
ncbi:major facilitator superfamily domain-containing protein [Mucor mucedo]|uniref:major facilitator superfamily domain-containing protein n=1 Tax=Mucor mucedo TaxID=29922 RepID=UPI002220B1C7|nr:major facilitator superfamily domain-containing protein [Mucor mucedo]KAI7881722.1 major facilitator superfamily domain-containing protein [Mucor mucedo]